MKRYLFALLAAVLVLAAGCSFFPAIEGSGFPRTMSFDNANFSRVVAEQPFKVHIVPDTRFSVNVTCDDNLVPYLVIEMNYDALKLSLQSGYNYRSVILAAEVHMPVLAGLSMSGASEARIDAGFVSSLPLRVALSGASTAEMTAVTCGMMSADISGASSLTVWNLATSALSATVSGASSLTAQGSSGSETVIVSGASSASLLDCAASQANVTLSGASKGWINVGNGRLALALSGVSTLFFVGNPIFVINELSGYSSMARY